MLRSIRVHHLAVFFILVLAGLFMTQPKNALAVTGADWRAGKIIDDSVFYNNGDMTAGDIQNFLNSKVNCDTWGTKPSEYGGGTRAQYGASRGYPAPYTCLKDYSQNGKSAAQIIKEAADTYRISSKSLIVLLQKEQALVTDEWPWPIQYRSATGYGCPDTAPCDAEYYGFQNQVMKAAYQFRRYATYPSEYRYKPYQANYIQYNPNAGCGGTNVVIENLATAGLYNYTPYQPNSSALNNLYGTGDGCGAYGNRNFWRLFNDWFGTTSNGKCSSSGIGVVSTNQIFHKYNRNIDSADFTIYSGTGSDCIESHVWNRGMQSWQTHIASNQPTINYPDAQVLYGDLDGSGLDYPVLFGVRNTGTGKVEAHVWNRDMKSFLVHTATNQPAIDPSDCKIILADLDGLRRDNAYLICEKNTGSGMIEVHKWNPGLQTWAWHAITNMPTSSTGETTVTSGDVDGDSRDELIFVAYNNTGSGKIEFHIWNPGFWSWRAHIATNQDSISTSTAFVTFADTDGNGMDEGVLVANKNTGSGKIEFHIWNPGFWSWRDHIASNQITP
jgi:hypothetical protein